MKFKLPNIFGRGKNETPVLKAAKNYSDIDPIFQVSFTGEKTPGEISPTKEYIPDYQRLNLKSWQLFHESELAQICIWTDINWVIGSGLNLKAEPKINVLKNLGIDFNQEAFSRDLEELFKVYKKSYNSTWSKTKNLDQLARQARLTKIVGGDVLYVYRYNGKQRVSVQAIDGYHVCNPNKASDLNAIRNRGNRVVHGVEINKNGEHIAFWVRVQKENKNNSAYGELNILDYEFKRVLARGPKSKRILAKLSYGSQYRIDEVRGMPIMSALIETAQIVQRYKDAAIGSAEERQKIAYAFQHGTGSDGSNPLEQQIANAELNDMPVAPETLTEDGYAGFAIPQATATRVATSTKKQVINMPIDAQIKVLESKNELYFKDFVETNFGFFCAALGQPPEVALMSFNSNFSASRMAGKMWEYNVEIKREQEGEDVYKPFKNLVLEVAIRTGMLPYSEPYFDAQESGWVASEAFEFCRFVGIPIPHVDPVKEVEAERRKLGKGYDQLPLTSPEDAAERLNLGDVSANIEEYKRNYDEAFFILEKQKELEEPETTSEGEENV